MTRLLMLATGPADRSTFIVDSDTEVVLRAVPGLPEGFDSAHDWALADLAVLAAGQGAEAEGFDAVCLADFGDYGAGALRSVLRIPVVTAGRSAMLYALTLGSRFAILAPYLAYPRAKKLVQEYGLSGQCASVRSFETAPEALVAATLCIDDGADVLCLAGQDTALAASLSAELQVPVVAPARLVLKLAESFLGLGLSQSRRAWPEPQLRKPELIAALLAAGGSDGR